MNKLLTENQISILLKTVEKVLNIVDLKYIINDKEILFYKNNLFFGYFYLDEIHFHGETFEIQSIDYYDLFESSFYKEIRNCYKKIIKDIDKYFSNEISKTIFLMNETRYHALCENFCLFIKRMPDNLLTNQQKDLRNAWRMSSRFISNKFVCECCETNAFIWNNDNFECAFCKTKVSYRHQFNFCKMTKSVLSRLVNWDLKINDFFQKNKILFLYFVALTLVERYGYNLDIDSFAKTMIRYHSTGFDAIDDEGNVHTYFFYLNNTNFTYFNNNSYLKKYWKYQLENIESKISFLSKKYPTKKFSILYIDKPMLLTGINTILTKTNYKKILKYLNDSMYDNFENLARFSKYHNLEKIEIFNNLSINHYVIGLREISYSLMRFLISSHDLKLYTFDNQNKTFKFNGPQHGFMELILNELNEVEHFGKLDMMLHVYDYSISSVGLFKQSWLVKHAIASTGVHFKRMFAKLLKINAMLKEKTFKKTS